MEKILIKYSIMDLNELCQRPGADTIEIKKHINKLIKKDEVNPGKYCSGC